MEYLFANNPLYAMFDSPEQVGFTYSFVCLIGAFLFWCCKTRRPIFPLLYAAVLIFAVAFITSRHVYSDVWPWVIIALAAINLCYGVFAIVMAPRPVTTKLLMIAGVITVSVLTTALAVSMKANFPLHTGPSFLDWAIAEGWLWLILCATTVFFIVMAFVVAFMKILVLVYRNRIIAEENATNSNGS